MHKNTDGRFITEVSKRAYIEARINRHESGCWIWTLTKHPRGYGYATWQYVRHMAHRFVYEELVGPIPDGLVIDHLCRNTSCVNPEHLEPVTQGENVRRGMSPGARVFREGRCHRGHARTEDNLWVSPTSGARRCRECDAIRGAEQYAREKKRLGIPDFKPAGTCDQPACGRKHYGRGLCKKHYQSWYSKQRVA